MRVRSVRPQLKTSQKAWQREAQPGELAFHEEDQWRRSDDFPVDSARLFGHFGLGAHDYADKTVLDLGAGSRLRTRYFEGAHLIAVEPLAEQFRKLDFSDLDAADELYATPAEEFLSQCVNRVDLVASINVLDHCYDFDAIVRNVSRYLATNGLALLSFDIHTEVDPLHPLILTPRVCRQVFRRHGLQIVHKSKGFGRDLDYKYYGHPPYAMNFLVRAFGS
jgi:SAM-dependent methyltransferase